MTDASSSPSSPSSPSLAAPLWSGLCGAVASSLAKLAFASHQLLLLQDASEEDDATILALLQSVSWWEWVLRLTCLVGMVLTNAVAVGTFVQGLEDTGSVKGTALSTAANCLASALLGWLVWHDELPSGTLGGLLLVLLGIGVLVWPSKPSTIAAIDAKKVQ